MSSYTQIPQRYSPPQMAPSAPVPLVVTLLPTSGLATASMVLGILGLLGGWCVFGIPCALAVLFGHLALAETKKGHKSGNGMAVAGLVMGYIVIGPAIVLSILFVFFSVLGSA